MTTVMRKAAIVVAVATIGLAGCTGVKESFGAAKQAPDETAITTRAPLVVPATFDLKTPGLCTSDECFDEILLADLDQRIAALEPARRARGVVLAGVGPLPAGIEADGVSGGGVPRPPDPVR